MNVRMLLNTYRGIQRLKSISCRLCHTAADKEFKILVPWGSIAGIERGSPGDYPILGLHGWLDNASTFDKISPHLKNTHFVCVDLPGHGFSSHFPKGFDYSTIFSVSIIKRVAEYFKWDKFSILGHSMGGGLGVLFSGTYPEMVDKLVMIDLIKLISAKADDIPDITRTAFDTLINLERMHGYEEKTYSLEEAKKRLIESHGSQLTDEAANILLSRGVQKSTVSEGYVFSRDIRVAKVFGPHKFTTEILRSFSSRINCNLLVIKARDAPYFQDKKLCEEFLKVYEKSAKSYKYIEVAGNHHVHLNNPDIVGRILSDFFHNRC